uniref:Protein kinase domain-containing protein n=1 Tax=Spongospora subterranea TaxID=70186 RepID=A0A0H5RAW5_9EUKA|eukprot:CRZ10941.1 hypothetical protein [Spongospora subterranea]
MWAADGSDDNAGLARSMQSITLAAGDDRHGDAMAREFADRISLAPRPCCQDLAQQVLQLQTALTHAHYTITGLNNDVSRSAERFREFEGEINGVNVELQQRMEDVSSASNRISGLEHQLLSANDQIHRLQEELVQARQQNFELGQQQEITSQPASSIVQQFRDLCRPGWIMDRHELEISAEVIGTGAYGSVRSGIWRGCPVAIKSIHGVILSPYNRSLFEREMYLYSLLSHPHLLKCYGACTDEEDVPLLILEKMTTSLRAILIRRAEPFPAHQALKVISAIAAALYYLHNLTPAPIVHRDLSSANVLCELADNGSITAVKLSDFGSAHFVDQTATAAPGAPIYSAPEVLQGSNVPLVFRTASDIYSFGALVAEIFTGQQPDPQRRNQQVMTIRSQNIRQLVERCIAADWRRRPTAQSICTFLARLSDRIRAQRE